MKKLLIIHNIFPIYIKGFWDKFIFSDEIEVEFYFSSKDFNGIKGLKIKNNYDKVNQNKFHFVKNYIYKNILFWQTEIVKASLLKKYDTIIFLGEANIMSTWLAALLGRIRMKKVIFRGHGMYGNEKGIRLFLRSLFYKIPNEHLVYSEGSKKVMIENGFSKNKIHVIFNSLNYAYQKDLFFKFQSREIKKSWSFFNNDYPTIFFLGRLTEIKKIDLLIKAVVAVNKNKLKLNLLVIGGGEEFFNLKEIAKELTEIGQCHFTGEVYEELELANYIYYSDLCISPGNIGLTAIHSLSYGTPIATHSNRLNQGPEHEIIIDFVNGFYFKENSSLSLTDNLLKWFEKSHKQVDKDFLRKPIDLKYNPNYQFDLIKKLFINK